jgi:hypothetical protein
MKSTSEILNIFKGMRRDFLYYLESAHFITPLRVKKGRVFKRSYDENTIEKIRAAWHFYQQGFSPSRAFELAQKISEPENNQSSQLHISDFFKTVLPKSIVKIQEGSLLSLGVLNAPMEKPKAELVFVAVMNKLPLIAKRMIPHLIDIDFVITADDIASLLIGACSMLFHDTANDISIPIVVRKNDVSKVNQLANKRNIAALILGSAYELNEITKIIDEIENTNIDIKKLVILASSLTENDELILKDKGLEIIYFFNQIDIKGMSES